LLRLDRIRATLPAPQRHEDPGQNHGQAARDMPSPRQQSGLKSPWPLHAPSFGGVSHPGAPAYSRRARCGITAPERAKASSAAITHGSACRPLHL